MFVVIGLHMTAAFPILDGVDVEVSLCFADGMVGVLPVFMEREQAEEYAGNSGAEIMEINLVTTNRLI